MRNTTSTSTVVLTPNQTLLSLTGCWGISLEPWSEEFDGYSCKVVNSQSHRFKQFGIEASSAVVSFSPAEQQAIVSAGKMYYVCKLGMETLHIDPALIEPEISPGLRSPFFNPTVLGVSDDGRKQAMAVGNQTMVWELEPGQRRMGKNRLDFTTTRNVSEIEVLDNAITVTLETGSLVERPLDWIDQTIKLNYIAWRGNTYTMRDM
jgi:hypothetical protein